MKKKIATLLLFCVVLFFGCGRKEYPTLYIYCNETFWFVMQEEALAFNKIYGPRLVLIPVRASRTSDGANETVEINGDPSAPAPWQSMPETQVTPREGIHRAQMHPEIERLIDNIAKESFGDLFLSDSQRHVEQLQRTALFASEFPVCYLTLTMLVPTGNPHQFRSVKDVFDSNGRLGIIDPLLDGLGEESLTVLGRVFNGDESAIPMEFVQLYERQYDLLEALEQNKIDAALVWDATSLKNFLLAKYADEYNADTRFEEFLRKAGRQRNPQILRDVLDKISTILFEEKNFAEEVLLTANPSERQVISIRLIALSSTSNHGLCKRFADFMRSNQGKVIFRRFGFVAP